MNAIPATQGQTPVERPAGTRPWKALLLLLLLFVIGVGCGVGGSLFALRRVLQRGMAERPALTRAPVDRLMSRFSQEISEGLELDAVQRRAVEVELEVTAGELKRLRAETTANMQRIAEDTIIRVERHLPEDKRPAFREGARKRLEPWGLYPKAEEKAKSP